MAFFSFPFMIYILSCGIEANQEKERERKIQQEILKIKKEEAEKIQVEQAKKIREEALKRLGGF